MLVSRTPSCDAAVKWLAALTAYDTTNTRVTALDRCVVDETVKVILVLTWAFYIAKLKLAIHSVACMDGCRAWRMRQSCRLEH